MKIVYFSREEWEEDYVKGKLVEDDITFFRLPAQDYPTYEDKDAEILSIFVKSHISSDELDRFPNVKLIATRSTGFDHIDLKETSKRGIVVSSVPAYGANTVAEQSFALLLNLSRRIYESYSRVLKEGKFSPEGLRGFDLKNKTIGIVGTGNIGIHAVKIAHGFGMKILAFDIKKNEEMEKDFGVKYVEFDELLAQSDIVSLYAPYNKHTHHMINMDNIDKIKKGAYLINTARGGLVETKSLVYALEKNILKGAGLDVLEEEGNMDDDTELLFGEHPNPESLQTLLANQYLIDHPGVLITPHNAFNTKEAVERIVDTTIDNIQAFKKGEPINIVSNNK
jgi:D-lactate dehydrogenase